MAVAPGTKLNPDTPIPLQLPPVGPAVSGTNVSLIQILVGKGAIDIGVLALTVSVALAEVTL